MTDWSREQLNMAHLAYAANDVFVAYEVAVKIKQLQKLQPKLSYHVTLTTIKDDGADVPIRPGTLQKCENEWLRRLTTASKKLAIKNKLKDAILFGNRSTIKILRPKKALPIARSFSSYGCVSLDNRTDVRHPALDDDTNRHDKDRQDQEQGNISIPSHLLPGSMEGMDIMERNQVIWLKAGGRDSLEEDDDDVKDDDDWYLKQNQALLESLLTDDAGGQVLGKAIGR